MLVLGSLFLMAGLLLFFGGARALLRDIRFAKQAQRLTGEVVGFAEMHSPGGGRLTAPRVAVRLPSGQELTVRGGLWSGFTRYQLGEIVPLLAGLEEDRLRVVIDKMGERFSGFPTALIGGGLLAAVGLFALLHGAGIAFAL
jgi:hypothetical protein